MITTMMITIVITMMITMNSDSDMITVNDKQ